MSKPQPLCLVVIDVQAKSPEYAVYHGRRHTATFSCDRPLTADEVEELRHMHIEAASTEPSETH